jgi:hypothetical protein
VMRQEHEPLIPFPVSQFVPPCYRASHTSNRREKCQYPVSSCLPNDSNAREEYDYTIFDAT